jgi:pimeloyl-ACP methyl ester carboxylesterase
MIFLRDRSPDPAATLIVLLPGAYMLPADFVTAGFVSALRQRSVPLDVAMAQLDLASIGDGSCLPALRDEAIMPARQAGYRSIWLCGISLGGFLCLSYVERFPGEVDGLCLLAPYPGNRLTTGDIEARGGLAAWQATEDSLQDPEVRVWHWIKTCRAKPSLYLAYGKDDRFAGRIGLLASSLPDAQISTCSGGHDWPTWRRLWDDFIDATFTPAT